MGMVSQRLILSIGLLSLSNCRAILLPALSKTIFIAFAREASVADLTFAKCCREFLNANVKIQSHTSIQYLQVPLRF